MIGCTIVVEYGVQGDHREDETLYFPSLPLSPHSLKNFLITDWPPRYLAIWKQVLNRRKKQVSQEYHCCHVMCLTIIILPLRNWAILCIWTVGSFCSEMLRDSDPQIHYCQVTWFGYQVASLSDICSSVVSNSVHLTTCTN